jgi:predicted O-linked N-acetylglucosamine transferase (SPINDLY family)
VVVPEGTEALFAERPARLRAPCFAYEAPENLPAVSATPALENGFITLGSLSRTIRLNRRCLSVWLELLTRMPSSHLILNSYSFRETAVVERFSDYFISKGIAASRLHIGLDTPPWPVYQKIDIMLDCFPHNSGTTLFEGLFMGVPFVTRRDRVSMGRLGATIAQGAGHPEWIAGSDEEYITKVLTLGADPRALNQLRLNLRNEMLASPLCDQQGFTQRVEQTYADAWQRYCDRQSLASLAV